MSDEVVRVVPRATRCCCRLKMTERLGWDSCPGYTSGPDEPICRDCVNAEHPESPRFDPVIKN